MLETLFRLSKAGTSVRTELLAGVATFLTMAYITVVNPGILSTALVYYLKDGRRNIILLPSPYDLMPAGIAAGVIEEGVPGDHRMTVYQRLTHEDEQSWSGSVSECAAITTDFSDLSIMIFHRPISE